ncbi:VCBS repeat-containing protein [Rubripirellula amarantea]|nr:VCBS repeat-containing protein [Rubripirellula amarantea]
MNKKFWLAVFAAIIAIAIAAMVFLPQRLDNPVLPVDGGGPAGGSDSTGEMLSLTRTALAATENLEVVEADTSWQQLYVASPSDVSIAKNRALNRVLWVDTLAGKATNASLDDAAKKAARSELPDAIEAARTAIDQYANLVENSVLAIWLRTRIDMHEASLIPSMTKSMRREIFDELSTLVQGDMKDDPASAMLGGSLITLLEQMEDPVDGLPRAIIADASNSVGALSDAHNDNLFFALKAARLKIETEQTDAVPYVKRVQELTRAIEPSVASETRKLGLTPEQLVDNITEAVANGEFSEADNRMLLWFNVLNSSEIVKTDRRRASPHPLDLLSFDSLRTLSTTMAGKSPIERAQQSLAFEYREVDAEGSSSIQSTMPLDFDLDLDEDLVVIRSDNQVELLQNDSEGNFQKVGAVDVGFSPAGILFADLFIVDSSSPERLRSGMASVAGRHDTFMSMIVYGEAGVKLIRVDGRSEATEESRLSIIDKASGLEGLSGVTAAVAGDLEADGDLDLVFATESDGVRMFVNRGNRTFTELTTRDDAFSRDDVVTSLAIADVDRDLDLDMVSTHRSGKVGMIENLLHLQFRGRVLEQVEPVEGADAIFVEDVDGNVSWDLVIGGRTGMAVVFTQTADAGAWTVDRVESLEMDASGLLVADLDNDSWFEATTSSGLVRLGPWGCYPVPDSNNEPVVSCVADFDGDGGLDVATTDDGLQIGINRTESVGHYLNVRFKGIDDNVSGRVNHFAIGSVLEIRFGPHYRARIIKSPSTHFGIDGLDAASSVRAILPNGLTQTIRDPATDQMVEEEQTLKGSCPYLYAWDGEKYAFVTDCLWAAPLGLQVAAGVVAKDRPWEYLKIDGANIQPQGDHYQFRITEELWEVAYFDKVAIQAVDHPVGVDIWTNEKVGSGEIASPTVFAFQREDTFAVQSAVDTDGNDITSQITDIDRNFVQGFDRRLRQGLCPPHWIDLDFRHAKLVDGKKTYLVLTGWILPTDTSLNIQIDQNPDLDPIEFPSVWVPDASVDGGWRNAIPFTGFPGGKTKTIVIDVTDVLNPLDQRLRVRTSAQIYWDAAELAVARDDIEFVTHDMSLQHAEVTFHGFSKRIKSSDREPEVYDYNESIAASRWPPLRGKMTGLGECTDLLRQWDDAMVVMSAGDEIRLQFTKPEQDPPPGWVRDFVLHCVGWDKDADLNTLAGQTIGPLPYREMTQYPPSVTQARESAGRVELNAVHRSREQSFRRFWYREAVAPPMWQP